MRVAPQLRYAELEVIGMEALAGQQFVLGVEALAGQRSAFVICVCGVMPTADRLKPPLQSTF